MNYLDNFIEDGRVQGWTARSANSYFYAIKVFLESTNKDPVDTDEKDLKTFLKYLDARGLSNVTISRYFAVLSSFFKFLEYEELVNKNPVPRFRDRYLKTRLKNKNNGAKRQLITIGEMRDLINSILDPKDRAIAITLAKTGVRLSELVNMDVSDVNWIEQTIKIKPNGKRSNLTVYFDDECGRILRRYITIREELAKPEERALFVSYYGVRLQRRGIELMISKYAQRLNLHNPASTDLQRRFTPHCCRHWFTTHLRRAGMPREHIQELRGDSRTQTMDIYLHLDAEELKQSYRSFMPQLGV